MDIDYHTVGEDIITASNTVDNDETHEFQSINGTLIRLIMFRRRILVHHNESYDINKAKLRFIFPDWWSAKQKWQRVMRVINGVMMRTG